jgi:hypothetical protein
MKKLAKAQVGKVIQSITKAVKPAIKAAPKELTEFQKARIASGKPISVNVTIDEQKTKRALNKAISERTGAKKLSKKEAYQKAIDDMNRKKGGVVKSKKK